METIVMFLVLVVGFIALDLGSVRLVRVLGTSCPTPTSANQRLTSGGCCALLLRLARPRPRQ